MPFVQSALFFRKFEFRAVKSGKIILDGLCPADELEASVRPEKNLRGAQLAVVIIAHGEAVGAGIVDAENIPDED